ncbi:MAG TPA: VIT domain-containing protein [Saprospiraceae bacterium]|nr:VIT domain-containing protein [Saprospiraceae bacterium]
MRQILVSLFCLLQLLSYAQTENTNRSLSPYFQVNGGTPGVETLPLKSTSANVQIAGFIADVVVSQVYCNTGKKPLEAVYVFPGSTNAAVYGLSMQVGKRVIQAKIFEKQAARQGYEQAKSEGKRASLLEQERPNVFQMNVANIMPGDTIQVTLRYTEMLIPEEGIYEFVYPTVVGPRYMNGSETGSQFAATPYQHAGDTPNCAFDVKVHISAGMAIKDLNSSSHKVKISNPRNSEALVRLDPSEKNGGNRDFILRYGLRGNQIETGMLLFDDGKEKFFLCMAQPPRRVAAQDVPPREYIFVVDVSGSMHGAPLDVSKKLLRNLISHLQPNDRFNVILFAGTSALMSEQSLPGTQENINRAVQLIDQQSGGGGTELNAALKRALHLPRHMEGLSRSILLITDGYIGLDRECISLVKDNLNQANLFAFGIGSSVNRYLMEGVAHAGQGKPFIVTDMREADKAAEKFRKYVAEPVLTNVWVSFNGFDAYDIQPSFIPDVMSDRPVMIIGKWRGAPTGTIQLNGYSGDKPLTWGNAFQYAKDKLSGTQQNRLVSLEMSPENASFGAQNAALRYLWARERIRQLDDYAVSGNKPEEQAEVLNLGLTYNLLTAYTSFLAVEETPVNPDGSPVKVKQTLPMPSGVSDLAVGYDLDFSGVSGLPAKGFSVWYWVLGGLLAAGLVLVFRRKNARMIKAGALVVLPLLFCQCSSDEPVSTVNGHSVTFLIGDDRGIRNPYFAHAKAYFSTDSVEKTDFVEHTYPTLQDVYQYLATHRPADGPWQRVHLVVHGNQWTGMRVPVAPYSPDHTDGALMEQAIQLGVFRGLPREHVGPETKIVINGCNIGQDARLIQAMSTAFNGAAISADPYLTIFDQSEGQVKRYLASFKSVVFPAGTYPGNKWVSGQLASQYGRDTICWEEALCRHKPRFPKDSYLHYFPVTVRWRTYYPDASQAPVCQTEEEKYQFVKQHPDLSARIRTMDLLPEQFRWTFKADQDPQNGFYQETEGIAMAYGVLVPE